ncbi:uncharacterized protein EAF01_009030 [Botrytis porri]|uniref:uncharacterized protein n=1 Tax=Botrytis porri TaxID=87229 RepID=UPI0018FF4E78|nr:uncharacterized protein EAF01_009030 [Botrytis porri]KAF7896627.1 hypothetical protein EAF01_009030 [Botrytis porri]
MVNSKPTVVFIPGFWHTPEGFTPLAKLLDKEGYPPVLVNLPSAGAHPGHPDFSQDVAAICKIVTELSNEGKEVLVVMHSGESVSGSEATRNLGKKERQADRKNGGIVRVIYIGILLPKAGKTMFETFQGVVSSSDIDPNFVVDQDQSFHVFAELGQQIDLAFVRSWDVSIDLRSLEIHTFSVYYATARQKHSVKASSTDCKGSEY